MAHIYQILGCEQCQSCCPKNELGFSDTSETYSVTEILDGSCIKTLRQTAGKNFAKPANLKNQAIAYLANTAKMADARALQLVEQLGQEPVHQPFYQYWRKKQHKEQ